jgi:hypothetical protein
LDHKQIFNLGRDLSTSEIIFPNYSDSIINFEDASIETLAFLYTKGYSVYIPTCSFLAAKDKFKTIFLESKEEKSEIEKFDFIHPSYHEAFWYAIKENSRSLDC